MNYSIKMRFFFFFFFINNDRVKCIIVSLIDNQINSTVLIEQITNKLVIFHSNPNGVFSMIVHPIPTQNLPCFAQ
jgi:hypothetical protein